MNGSTRRQCLLCGGAALLACAPAAVYAQDEVVEVVIRDYKFVPDVVKIKRGTRVRWVNQEKRTSHSVLFTGPDGFESERLLPDETYTRRFDSPGVFAYRCGPHPEMTGRVEVAP